MSKIFVSHASQNAWLIDGLIALMRSASPEAEVFCSSEASILPGANYKKTIFSSLHDADVFVAVLSDEYWKSKYCVIELGAAYERYCFEKPRGVSIQPVVLPPMDKGLALANTPLVELQLTNLLDPAALRQFLQYIASYDSNGSVEGLELSIAEYVAFVHRSTLATTSFMADADMGAYYDELPHGAPPKDRIVRCHRMGDESFQFDFWLSRLSYTPSFASVAAHFWEVKDLKEYLKFDSEAALTCTVENMEGALRGITIEFKCDPGQRVFYALHYDLAQGENHVRVPLAEMLGRPLDRVRELCFVVHPEDVVEFDGRVSVTDIHVDFAEKNRLV